MLKQWFLDTFYRVPTNLTFYIKGHGNETDFFFINRFGMVSLRNLSRRSDFCLRFAEMFVIENLLPATIIRGIAHSAYYWYGESLTPISIIWESAIEFFWKKSLCIGDAEGPQLPSSVTRRGADSPYYRFGVFSAYSFSTVQLPPGIPIQQLL